MKIRENICTQVRVLLSWLGRHKFLLLDGRCGRAGRARLHEN